VLTNAHHLPSAQVPFTAQGMQRRSEKGLMEVRAGLFHCEGRRFERSLGQQWVQHLTWLSKHFYSYWSQQKYLSKTDAWAYGQAWFGWRGAIHRAYYGLGPFLDPLLDLVHSSTMDSIHSLTHYGLVHFLHCGLGLFLDICHPGGLCRACFVLTGGHAGQQERSWVMATYRPTGCSIQANLRLLQTYWGCGQQVAAWPRGGDENSRGSLKRAGL